MNFIDIKMHGRIKKNEVELHLYFNLLGIMLVYCFFHLFLRILTFCSKFQVATTL